MIVKFWPKPGTIAARICNHRYDAVMTFSHASDTIVSTSIQAVEMFGFRNNIRMGVFGSNIDGSVFDVAPREATGLIRHDIYFPTDRWAPDGGTPVVIPDYNATSWTAAGAAVFPGISAGQSKAVRTPNHGQQLFNVSNGQFGYDLTTGTPGLSNQAEFTNVIAYLQDWLFSLTGRKNPSAFSYRNGRTEMATISFPYYLGGRNSIPGSAPTGNANTFYGLSKQGGGVLGLPADSVMSRSTFASFPSSSRWWDFWNSMGMSQEDATAYIQAQIALTIGNHGWYKDFMHWHSAQANGTLQSVNTFLSACRSAFGSNFVHACSLGESLEYMFLRTMAKRINTVQRNNTITVMVDIEDSFKDGNTNGIPNDLPLQAIDTPLTIEIDLTGTPLAGLPVKSSHGKLVNKGSNIFLAEIPFLGQKEGFLAVILSEDTGANYLELTPPTGTITTSTNAYSVITPQPTRAVLFEANSGDPETAYIVRQRSNTFSQSHSLTTSAGKIYKIGLINEAGQAALLTP